MRSTSLLALVVLPLLSSSCDSSPEPRPRDIAPLDTLADGGPADAHEEARLDAPTSDALAGWQPLTDFPTIGTGVLGVRAAPEGLYVATDSALFIREPGESWRELLAASTGFDKLWRVAGTTWGHRYAASGHYSLRDGAAQWTDQGIIDCFFSTSTHAYRLRGADIDSAVIERWDAQDELWSPWSTSTVLCHEFDVDTTASIDGRLLYTRVIPDMRLLYAEESDGIWHEVSERPPGLDAPVAEYVLVTPNTPTPAQIWLVPTLEVNQPLYASRDGLSWESFPALPTPLREYTSIAMVGGVTYLAAGEADSPVMRLAGDKWEALVTPAVPDDSPRRQLFVWDDRLHMADGNGISELL